MDLKNWAREFAFRPRWAFYRASEAWRRRLDKAAHHGRCNQFPKLVQKLPNALGDLLSISPEEIERLLHEYEPPELAANESVIPPSWGASANLLQAYFVLCRLLKPKLVVETGVATGVSSALLLRELSRDPSARLISVELPGLGRLDQSYIGSRIPSPLKRNWTLIVAPAVPALRRMQDMMGKVDIFIHDSDHSYDNQWREYVVAIDLLKPGGILASDDVHNDAFLEICEKAGSKPIIVHRRENQGFVGLTQISRVAGNGTK